MTLLHAAAWLLQATIKWLQAMANPLHADAGRTVWARCISARAYASARACVHAAHPGTERKERFDKFAVGWQRWSTSAIGGDASKLVARRVRPTAARPLCSSQPCNLQR